MINVAPPASSKPHDDLATLLRRAQDGSDDAAQVVFDRCRRPLLAVIRRLIQRPLRRLYDSDDFLLSTFKEIFTKHFSDEVLRGPDTLWPYLKRIAENKVHDAARRHLISRSRALDADVPLDDDLQDYLESRELSPLDVMILNELVEERLEDLIDQLPVLLQNIVDLLLEGYSGIKIAMKLRVEPKRVYRAIDWLKKKVLES
jgi:DNA-directed RNA polymerase specialized sigma24 family protein